MFAEFLVEVMRTCADTYAVAGARERTTCREEDPLACVAACVARHAALLLLVLQAGRRTRKQADARRYVYAYIDI